MRVLLVEDDPLLGAAVRDQVAADGHTVDWMTRLDDARVCVGIVTYQLGAFDIGVGALVSAWGFGPGSGAPDREMIAAAAPLVAATAGLELDPAQGRARKQAPLCLDLSGIAKGFGVDEMAQVMDRFGIASWLVGIDGDMRARGLKPDGAPWAVAHERPDRHRREAMGVIELTDLAVATSGNYRHWAEHDGQAVSHTIDPATGKPVAHGLASACVLAETCMTADAWATAFMVMGAEAALRRAAAVGVRAILVLADGTLRSTL